MTIKRLILILLTILAIAKITLSLISSWGEPQIQSRLELYQTNLLLHATEWKGDKAGGSNFTTARDTFLGVEPVKTAQNQYEEVLKTDRNTLEQIAAKVLIPPAVAADSPRQPEGRQELQKSLYQLEGLIEELNLRLGILQIHQGQTETAIKTWTELINGSNNNPQHKAITETADVLIRLWQNPPVLVMNAQEQIENNLDGWFRYVSLSKLYEVQEKPEALANIQVAEQEIAEQALIKLAIVAGIPGFGFFMGVLLLIVLLGQLLIQRKDALLAQNAQLPWTTPWDAETTWQVLIVGFFFVGQFVLPLVFSLLPLNPAGFDVREKAYYVLASYMLMAFGSLLVLYLSIKSFLPLPEGWFQFKWKPTWIFWGVGGYFVALPLVIVVSLINQKLWQGQGGSNPILPIVLEGKDGVALGIFFFTASIAAPLFEEIIFRGFLLPSLTRYFPVWGAIAASSLLFAIAHLSLSEVLPLATLGAVLGIVYTRSRNLLAPMLLHSLWNSGTLLSLFILGSGSK